MSEITIRPGEQGSQEGADRRAGQRERVAVADRTGRGGRDDHHQRVHEWSKLQHPYTEYYEERLEMRL